VLLVTDHSIAALQHYANAPRVCRKGFELLSGLTALRNVWEELKDADCEPSDPSKRISLGVLTGGVEEAKRATEALAAVHDVVPVAELLKALQRVAIQFSSAYKQKQEIGMMSALTQGVAEEGKDWRQRKPHGSGVEPKTGRCKFHDGPEGCNRSQDDCSYNHVGPARNGFQGPWGRSYTPSTKSHFNKRGSETAKLATAMTALVSRFDKLEAANGAAAKTNWCVDSAVTSESESAEPRPSYAHVVEYLIGSRSDDITVTQRAGHSDKLVTGHSDEFVTRESETLVSEGMSTPQTPPGIVDQSGGWGFQ
jgi:hypothetical protein